MIKCYYDQVPHYKIIFLHKIKHLTIINLQRFKTVALKQSQHLAHLNLSNGHLEDFFHDKLQNIIVLDLQNNRLKSVKSFGKMNLNKLQYLNLRNNFLEDDSNFVGLEQLLYLDISYTKIRIITNKYLRDFPKIRKFIHSRMLFDRFRYGGFFVGNEIEKFTLK